MRLVAILGAGDLGATVARRVAEGLLARRVVLVDPDEGKARGKALDIAQSGPVEGFDVHVEGCARLAEVIDPDAIVIADAPDLLDAEAAARKAREHVAGIAPHLGEGILLVALAHSCPLVAAAVEKGVARERVIGSGPVAVAAALRRRLADALEASARELSLTVLGLPPDHLVVPQASMTSGGIPVDRLSPVASRRALGGLKGHRAGPVALASAAARVLRALSTSSPSVLPVMAWLQGEYDHRGVAVAVPARLSDGRVQAILEFPLEPVEKVAFDTAVQHAREAAW